MQQKNRGGRLRQGFLDGQQKTQLGSSSDVYKTFGIVKENQRVRISDRE